MCLMRAPQGSTACVCSPSLSWPHIPTCSLFPSELLPWGLDTPPWSPCHLCSSCAPDRAILCPHHSPTARLPATPPLTRAVLVTWVTTGPGRTHPFSPAHSGWVWECHQVP